MVLRGHATIQRIVAFSTMVCFLTTSLWTSSSMAQMSPGFSVPAATSALSEPFRPAVLAGMAIDPDHPFSFEFIVDAGDPASNDSERVISRAEEFRSEEYLKLINYFLAALTVPEDEMWVNLSPAEPDRIIAKGLGQTEMGRDMLAQDYLLKQLTASLMSPEGDEGKKFWERVYEKIYQVYGTWDVVDGEKQEGSNPRTTYQIPHTDLIESFNKVWIIPDLASVYVHNNRVFVTNSHLKVMMEEDYLASGISHLASGEKQKPNANDQMPNAKQIIQQTILPLIEDEINTGKTFAPLRQMFHSMILAAWYKKNLKESVLAKAYVDQNKVEGIELNTPQPPLSERGGARRAGEFLNGDRLTTIDSIYQQYLTAFRSGVNDIIREEYDPQTQSVVPRKYFTGGVVGVYRAMLSNNASLDTMNFDGRTFSNVKVDLVNPAMMDDGKKDNNGDDKSGDDKNINRDSKPVEIGIREADSWTDLGRQHDQDMADIRQRQADEKIQNNAMLSIGKYVNEIITGLFAAGLVNAAVHFGSPQILADVPWWGVLLGSLFVGAGLAYLVNRIQKTLEIRKAWKESQARSDLESLLRADHLEDLDRVEDVLSRVRARIDDLQEKIKAALDAKSLVLLVIGDEPIESARRRLAFEVYVLARAMFFQDKYSTDPNIRISGIAPDDWNQSLKQLEDDADGTQEGPLGHQLDALQAQIDEQGAFLNFTDSTLSGFQKTVGEAWTSSFNDEIKDLAAAIEGFRQSHFDQNRKHHQAYYNRLMDRLDAHLYKTDSQYASITNEWTQKTNYLKEHVSPLLQMADYIGKKIGEIIKQREYAKDQWSAAAANTAVPVTKFRTVTRNGKSEMEMYIEIEDHSGPYKVRARQAEIDADTARSYVKNNLGNLQALLKGVERGSYWNDQDVERFALAVQRLIVDSAEDAQNNYKNLWSGVAQLEDDLQKDIERLRVNLLERRQKELKRQKTEVELPALSNNRLKVELPRLLALSPIKEGDAAMMTKKTLVSDVYKRLMDKSNVQDPKDLLRNLEGLSEAQLRNLTMGGEGIMVQDFRHLAAMYLKDPSLNAPGSRNENLGRSLERSGDLGGDSIEDILARSQWDPNKAMLAVSRNLQLLLVFVIVAGVAAVIQDDSIQLWPKEKKDVLIAVLNVLSLPLSALLISLAVSKASKNKADNAMLDPRQNGWSGPFSFLMMANALAMASMPFLLPTNFISPALSWVLILGGISLFGYAGQSWIRQNFNKQIVWQGWKSMPRPFLSWERSFVGLWVLFEGTMGILLGWTFVRSFMVSVGVSLYMAFLLTGKAWVFLQWRSSQAFRDWQALEQADLDNDESLIIDLINRVKKRVVVLEYQLKRADPQSIRLDALTSALFDQYVYIASSLKYDADLTKPWARISGSSAKWWKNKLKSFDQDTGQDFGEWTYLLSQLDMQLKQQKSFFNDASVVTAFLKKHREYAFLWKSVERITVYVQLMAEDYRRKQALYEQYSKELEFAVEQTLERKNKNYADHQRDLKKNRSLQSVLDRSRRIDKFQKKIVMQKDDPEGKWGAAGDTRTLREEIERLIPELYRLMPNEYWSRQDVEALKIYGEGSEGTGLRMHEVRTDLPSFIEILKGMEAIGATVEQDQRRLEFSMNQIFGQFLVESLNQFVTEQLSQSIDAALKVFAENADDEGFTDPLFIHALKKNPVLLHGYVLFDLIWQKGENDPEKIAQLIREFYPDGKDTQFGALQIFGSSDVFLIAKKHMLAFYDPQAIPAHQNWAVQVGQPIIVQKSKDQAMMDNMPEDWDGMTLEERAKYQRYLDEQVQNGRAIGQAKFGDRFCGSGGECHAMGSGNHLYYKDEAGRIVESAVGRLNNPDVTLDNAARALQDLEHTADMFKTTTKLLGIWSRTNKAMLDGKSSRAYDYLMAASFSFFVATVGYLKQAELGLVPAYLMMFGGGSLILFSLLLLLWEKIRLYRLVNGAFEIFKQEQDEQFDDPTFRNLLLQNPYIFEGYRLSNLAFERKIEAPIEMAHLIRQFYPEGKGCEFIKAVDRDGNDIGIGYLFHAHPVNDPRSVPAQTQLMTETKRKVFGYESVTAFIILTDQDQRKILFTDVRSSRVFDGGKIGAASGGHVGPAGDPDVFMIREVLEETGADVSDLNMMRLKRTKKEYEHGFAFVNNTTIVLNQKQSEKFLQQVNAKGILYFRADDLAEFERHLPDKISDISGQTWQEMESFVNGEQIETREIAYGILTPLEVIRSWAQSTDTDKYLAYGRNSFLFDQDLMQKLSDVIAKSDAAMMSEQNPLDANAFPPVIKERPLSDVKKEVRSERNSAVGGGVLGAGFILLGLGSTYFANYIGLFVPPYVVSVGLGLAGIWIIRLSVLKYRKAGQLFQAVEQVDNAAMNAPGGIDFNAKKMNLDENGGTMKFNLSNQNFDPAQLQNLQGLTPIIRSITPIADIRPLLGLNPVEDKQQDVSMETMDILGRERSAV